MSIGRFLVHRVSIVRRVAVLDEAGEVVVDEYNQPTTAESATAGVAASIQPRSAKELAQIAQGGAAVSDHRIYLLPRDLRTSDVIVHDPDACPMPVDLPDGRYEVVAVPDAAGAGRHIEVSARLVGSPGFAYHAPGAEGS